MKCTKIKMVVLEWRIMSFVSTSQTFCHVFKLPSWIINLNTDTFRLELPTYALFHIIKGIMAVGLYLARGYGCRPKRLGKPAGAQGLFLETGVSLASACKVWGQHTILEAREVSPPPRNWKGPRCSGQGLALPGLWRGPSPLCACFPTECSFQKLVDERPNWSCVLMATAGADLLN